jgi:hypothetical protein
MRIDDKDITVKIQQQLSFYLTSYLSFPEVEKFSP